MVTVANLTDFVNGDVLSDVPGLISNPGIDGISLREAILAANFSVGKDTIQFASNLDGLTINLNPNNGSLFITAPVDIVGPANNVTIQPQFAPTNEMYGLNYSIASGSSAMGVSGLTITGFTSGIRVSSLPTGSSLTVTSCTLSGNNAIASGNPLIGGAGIEIVSGQPVTIQLSTISSNRQYGVYVHNSSSSNLVTVANNIISGNTLAGIIFENANRPFEFDHNIITSTPSGPGILIKDSSHSTDSRIENANVIGDNIGAGVVLLNANFPSLAIQSNFIGLDDLGDDLSNGSSGIVATQSTLLAIQLNIIGFNQGDGIVLDRSNGVSVVSNRIGASTTNIATALDFGNTGSGIALVNGTDDSIITNNAIAYNNGDGITVTDGAGGTDHAIRNIMVTNAFWENQGIPIDLNNDGDSPNDPDDGDDGPNGLLNTPVLLQNSVAIVNGVWQVPVQVDVGISTAQAGGYGIQLYKHDPSRRSYIPVLSVPVVDLTGANAPRVGIDQMVTQLIVDGVGGVVGDRFAAVLIGDSGVYENYTSEFSQAITLTPPGDYNRNGTVECADYSLWRATFGNTVTPFDGADGNGNGTIDAADYVIWANAFSEVNIYHIGDFDHSGAVGVEDYLLWTSTFGSTTNLAADANCNGVVDAADYVIWRDTFGSMVGAALFGVLDAFAQGLPPEVVGFALSAAGGSSVNFAAAVGSGEQLRSVPLAGANSIRITFNQGVTVTQNDLTLVNLDGSAPSISSFSYNAESQTATWTFNAAFADGRYLVRLSDSVHNSLSQALDGGFTNPWSLSATGTSIFASGDGVAGGEFRFRFTVLAGDTDHNNIHGTANYQNWTSYEPGMIYVSSTADDYDGDLSFGDVSLREAVNYANTAAEATTIDLPAGRYTLTRIGTEDAGTALNDLDVTGDVTVMGAGPGLTVIDSAGLSSSSEQRVFDVRTAGARLDLSGVTLTGATSMSFPYGTAARANPGTSLVITDSAIVENNANYYSTVFVLSADATIRRSVFSNNSGYYSYGVAVMVRTNGIAAPSITIGQTIFALNSNGLGPSNVEAVASATKINEGHNVYDKASGGFFNTTPGEGDYLGTPDYVVTTVADTFDHSDDGESLSLREAMDLANQAVGQQEVWIPAWHFVLTRDRATYGGGSLTDTDISYGDLDIKDSLKVRGISGYTSIAWKTGVVDKVFDLLGDYSGGADANSVSSADYVIWQSQNGSVGAYEQFAADGDDDGDVDADDYTIWAQHFGNTLDLVDVLL